MCWKIEDLCSKGHYFPKLSNIHSRWTGHTFIYTFIIFVLTAHTITNIIIIFWYCWKLIRDLAWIVKKANCVCVCAYSCPILCDPMDCSLPGSSGHGISQARILKRVAISYSSGFSWLRNQTCVSCISCIGRRILYHSTIWEAQIGG